jgi:hypothetical protein
MVNGCNGGGVPVHGGTSSDAAAGGVLDTLAPKDHVRSAVSMDPDWTQLLPP